jgi:hypothetical protein
MAYHEVGKPEALVECPCPDVVVLDFEREPATPAVESANLGSVEESAANACPSVRRQDRQIVDIEEGECLKRGEPQETHGDANRSRIDERKEYQSARMIPKGGNKLLPDSGAERLSTTDWIASIGVQHIDDPRAVNGVVEVCLMDFKLH